MGSKDTKEDSNDEEEGGDLELDSNSEASELPRIARKVLKAQNRALGIPPASVSVGRPSAFGSSLGSPSVARMPGTGGGYELVGSRPVQNYNWTPPHIKAVYIDSRQIRHAIVIFLLPSGIGVKDAAGFRLAIKVFGVDHYLSLEIEWPNTFDLDNGEIFLDHLLKKQLKQMKKKWADLPPAQEKKAERERESSNVVMWCVEWPYSRR